ncbi:4814_t:CDS:2, partial [Dentiscutata erythropus]
RTRKCSRLEPTLIEINYDEFLQIGTEVLLTAEEATPAKVTTEFENHSKTWKDQVNRILTFLSSPGQTRVSLNKKIKAYYYLGLLIFKSNDPLKIKTFIQKAQSTRKAKDTWKGALRIYELFELRPKEIILQLRYTTATHIIKLPDQDYTQL